MKFSRFFWKILFSFLLCIGFGLASSTLFLGFQAEAFVKSEAKKNLADISQVLEQLMNQPDGLNYLLNSLSQLKLTGVKRITILDHDGVVIGESLNSPSILNQSRRDRPEILEALLHGTGYDERFSHTLNEEMAYFSRRISLQNKDLYIRVSIPTKVIKDRIFSTRLTLIAIFLVMSLCAIFLATWLAKKVTEPVERISEVADSLRRGHLSSRIKQWPNDELGELSKAFNALADSVEANIERRIKMETIRREFTSNVSHELKTPLTSIKGYLELMMAGALYDEANNMKFLDIMHKNVNHIISMVGDLLQLAAMEANEDFFALDPVDWRPVVDSALVRFQPQIDDKKLELKLKRPLSSSHCLVLGQKKAMRHVLENLIQNAINYTLEGGTITIDLIEDITMGHLKITDTGVGIAQKDLDRIFERFYRVDPARNRYSGGTGLGLSIVKHLVAQMHGSIKVESEIGKGSTFIISLPLAEPD